MFVALYLAEVSFAKVDYPVVPGSPRWQANPVTGGKKLHSNKSGNWRIPMHTVTKALVHKLPSNRLMKRKKKKECARVGKRFEGKTDRSLQGKKLTEQRLARPHQCSLPLIYGRSESERNSQYWRISKNRFMLSGGRMMHINELYPCLV